MPEERERREREERERREREERERGEMSHRRRVCVPKKARLMDGRPKGAEEEGNARPYRP